MGHSFAIQLILSGSHGNWSQSQLTVGKQGEQSTTGPMDRRDKQLIIPGPRPGICDKGGPSEALTSSLTGNLNLVVPALWDNTIKILDFFKYTKMSQ